MKRIWGFDLGTASVGFAVADHDEQKGEGKILKLGVRIFPEGVTEKTKEPRNLERRQARLARRQFRRRRWRKRALRGALVDGGLLPTSEREPRPRQTRGDFFLSSEKGRDPYELRAKGVNEKLEPYEIGRALFHLSKHRAFVGSRKFDSSKAGEKDREKEEKGIKQEIETHKGKMGGRSLGEYLQKEFPAPKPKRGHHFGREMVEEEFNRIWNTQSTFHPALLTDELKKRLRQIIFFQRPTFFRMKTVGRCDLEPGEDRCLKADWHAQRFVMLQMLNSIRLSGDRPLSSEQRGTILSRVEGKAKVSFQSLRKALKLGNEIFNFELGGKKDMLGNVTEQKLAGVFGAAWQSFPTRDKIRDEIAAQLWHVEYRLVGNKRAEIRDHKGIAAEREKFVRDARRDWGVNDEQAKALSELNLPDGHAMHSKRAMLKMLPHLEQGLRYDEAKDKAYPNRQSVSGKNDLLPPPPEVRNPTVMRTLNELRNVANNLLRVYGRPDLIRVELARDLKMPREQRNKLKFRQRDDEANRERAKKALAEGNRPAKGPNIEKWLLAEQQGWRCPYTGKPISWDGLFDAGLFQVDHILPRSRSFDNSFGNKVVCHRDANDEKAKRTPYEAWGKDADRWAEILKFLDDIEKYTQKSDLPFTRGKSARIKTLDYPTAGSEDFTNRQLVDNAYASKLAREYLATLGVNVQPANGRATGALRYLWGLNEILSDSPEKNRDDHRHHAIDALVVALTTPRFIKRASEFYGADARLRDQERTQEQKERLKKHFEEPWKTIHADAERAANEIIVSHRAQRKVSGALHDEMPWGDTGKEVNKGGTAYRLYAQRKDGKRVQEPMQSSLMRTVGPDHAAFVTTNSNHHIVVYKDAAGRLQCKIIAMFDAAMRIARREPIVNLKPEPGASKVMSLCIGDMIERQTGNGKTYWIVKKLSANGQIFIQPHNTARDINRTGPTFRTLMGEGARKVVVDPIGRVFAAND
jgi:CRISPR-associated endonuclease Csn1